MLSGAHLAAGVGFYAVIASLVIHMRQDLGLLAVAAGAVLGLRTAVQYGLYPPAGVVIDRLGPARAASAGCLIRALGFATLAEATHLPALAGAAILIGIGGCVYPLAGSSILAGLPNDWARRGFAWYTVAGQLSAVSGPVVGLLLVAGGGGFRAVAWIAAACWTFAAILIARLRVDPSHQVQSTRIRHIPEVVRRDRTLVRFALLSGPTTLLITQGAVVVPLVVQDSRLTTLFLSGSALCTALVQVLHQRSRSTRYGLALGFGSFAAAYSFLAPAAVLPAGFARSTLVGLAGLVHGLAQGAVLPALFQQTRAIAPPGLTGVYFGAVYFAWGTIALVSGLLTGTLFDRGTAGVVGALIALGACGAAAAMAARRALPPVPAGDVGAVRGHLRQNWVRPATAGRAERDDAGGRDAPGDSGRAGDGADDLVHDELVSNESAGHSRS